MKKLNVALVGCWHPHVPRYYPILQKRKDTVLSCIWDSVPARGNEWAQKLGAPFVADYAELLKRSDVDAVCIVAETCRHAELMKQAAEAGKHIFTEKSFTVTTAEASRGARCRQKERRQIRDRVHPCHDARVRPREKADGCRIAR